MTKVVLLVDDEPDVLNVLSLTLEMAGYQALTAQDGTEALTMLQNRPVALIISDINMPDMDGYQLYDLIRANPQWSKIPFFLLTGCRFLLDDEVRYGKTLGIDEYFIKPIRSEELLLAVWSRLSSSQQSVPEEKVMAESR